MPLAILMFSEKRQKMIVLGRLKPGPSLSAFTVPPKPLRKAGWEAGRGATRPKEAGGKSSSAP